MKRLVGAILALAFVSVARAEPVEAVRGLAQHVDVDYSGTLRPRGTQGETSPVRVRVVHTTNSPTSQRIEFIGAVAGQYDLRDFLERDDGRPLSDLAALPVTVVSTLPPNPGTDLYSSEPSWFNWRAHYRPLLWTAVALWAAAPIAYLAIRRLQRPAPPPPPAPAPPPATLEDELLAAIQVSGAGEPSIEDRARLELLLYRYFGQRVVVTSDLVEDRAVVIRAVREHHDARELVAALDRWLHARGGAEIGRREALAALEHLKRSRLTPDAPPAGVAP